MARTKTYSVPNMADGVVLDELEIRFKVMPNIKVVADNRQDPATTLIADPAKVNVKLQEKIYAETRMRVANNVDSELTTEIHNYEQFNTVNFPTFTKAQANALLAGVKKVFVQHRSNKNLSP